MELWIVVSNIHENSNALFNIISSQDVLQRSNMWYVFKKTNMNSKEKLQKPRSKNSYELLNDEI